MAENTWISGGFFFFRNMELWNPNFVEAIFIVIWKGSHNPIFRGLMIIMVIITPYQKKWSDMGLNNTEKMAQDTWKLKFHLTYGAP